jgi:hypothetical protein
MEQIVRPFQLLDPTATIQVPVVRDQVTVQPAHLSWGAPGNLPTPVQQDSTFNGINFRLEECGTQLMEDARGTEDIRVEQPGQPNNYVIVQRIRTVTFSRTSKAKFIGVFHTDTTDFGLPDFFVGSPFGDVPQQSKCKEQVYYNT